MKTYLITHKATIGRTKADGAQLPPVNLTFYSMVQAASVEAASDMVVQYSDPGFITKVANISEVGDTITSEDLLVLLKHKNILIEETF